MEGGGVFRIKSMGLFRKSISVYFCPQGGQKWCFQNQTSANPPPPPPSSLTSKKTNDPWVFNIITIDYEIKKGNAIAFRELACFLCSYSSLIE